MYYQKELETIKFLVVEARLLDNVSSGFTIEERQTILNEQVRTILNMVPLDISNMMYDSGDFDLFQPQEIL